MSRFRCKRCGESINVCTENKYVTFEGDIYCGTFCKNNRYVPKILARKSNNHKKKKLDRVLVCVIKNYKEYDEVRSMYGYKHQGFEVQIYIDKDILTNDRFFLLNYKTSIAKKIVYHGEHDYDKEKIEEILYRRETNV